MTDVPKDPNERDGPKMPSHQHRYTVPTEWETYDGELDTEGQKSPAITIVTKLKCELCPSVIGKNQTEGES